MKSNELRIGNYINIPGLFKKSNVIGIVEEIYKEEIKTDRCEAHVLLFEPIELTEEWLIKFGFGLNSDYLSEDNLYNDYVKNNVRISLPYLTYLIDNGDNEIEIKHVHQLQNLYFSLTGEELILNK